MLFAQPNPRAKVSQTRSKYSHYLLTFLDRDPRWLSSAVRARFLGRSVFLVLCARAKHQRHIIESIFLMSARPSASSRELRSFTPLLWRFYVPQQAPDFPFPFSTTQPIFPTPNPIFRSIALAI